MAITMKAARVNANLTQKEAAKALDISKNTLLNYELGRSIPKVDMARKMAALSSSKIARSVNARTDFLS